MAYREMLDRNARWAADRKAVDPGFFHRAAQEHRPKAIFVGCSDARVPCNLVTDTEVGELFVHRNVANQVSPTDVSLSAGLQYAIDALQVEEIIVCGHHNCGGVRAALALEAGQELHLPHVEAWVGPIRLLARLHRDDLEPLDEDARVDRLVEFNVAEQVRTLAGHPSVRAAWAAGRRLRVHGWVYDLPTGLLRSHVVLDGPAALPGGTSYERGARAK